MSNNSTGRFDCLIENKEKKNIFKESPKKELIRFKDDRNFNDVNVFKQKKTNFKRHYRGREDYNSFSRKIVTERKEEPKKFEMKQEDFPSL